VRKAIAPAQWQERRASARHEILLRSRQFGALAQLGERLICIQEVIGSIPIGSTRPHLGKNWVGSSGG
jgi:hypothetical protein